MKKELITSVALITLGGAAYAEGHTGGVSLSGAAEFGVRYDGGKTGTNRIDFYHEFDVIFGASGTTDGGIEFGAKVTIDDNEPVAISGGTPGTPNTPTMVAPGTAGTAGKANERTTRVYRKINVLRGSAANDNDRTCYIATRTHTSGDDTTTTFHLIAAESSLDLNSVDSASIISGFVGLNAAGTAIDFLPARTKADLDLLFGEDVVKPTEESDTLPDLTEIIEVGVKVTIEHKIITTATDLACAISGTAGAAHAASYGTSLLFENKANVPTELGGPVSVTEGMAGVPTVSPTAGHVSNNGSVYVKFGMHTLTIGQGLDAGDIPALAMADLGYADIGVDDNAEALRGKTKADIAYSASFGVGSIRATYGNNSGDGEYAIGVKGTFAPVTVGFGYDSNRVVSISGGVTQGLFKANVFYSQRPSDKAAMDSLRGVMERPKHSTIGADATYTISDLTSVSVAFSRHTSNSNAGHPAINLNAYGIGFSHSLGGGATLKAAIGSTEAYKHPKKTRSLKADLGIQMKF